MLQNIGTLEILIIAAIILLLFGASKLPEFARGLMKAKKEFKSSYADDSEGEEEKKSD
jgi:sec-independent protein translocase protein TatA